MTLINIQGADVGGHFQLIHTLDLIEIDLSKPVIFNGDVYGFSGWVADPSIEKRIGFNVSVDGVPVYSNYGAILQSTVFVNGNSQRFSKLTIQNLDLARYLQEGRIAQFLLYAGIGTPKFVEGTGSASLNFTNLTVVDIGARLQSDMTQILRKIQILDDGLEGQILAGDRFTVSDISGTYEAYNKTRSALFQQLSELHNQLKSLGLSPLPSSISPVPIDIRVKLDQMVKNMQSQIQSLKSDLAEQLRLRSAWSAQERATWLSRYEDHILALEAKLAALTMAITRFNATHPISIPEPIPSPGLEIPSEGISTEKALAIIGGIASAIGITTLAIFKAK